MRRQFICGAKNREFTVDIISFCPDALLRLLRELFPFFPVNTFAKLEGSI
jgi:hypothetical protein